MEKRKYVTSAPDRHGRMRHRFRLNGISQYLPGEPGSEKFEAAYSEALTLARSDTPPPRKPEPVDRFGREGTVKRLIHDYRRGGKYARLKPRTRESYEGVFADFIDLFGDAEVKAINSRFVLRMMDELQGTPSKANNQLRVLKMLMNYAILNGLISTNPTAGIEQYKLGEWDTWEEEHIALYMERWPIGTVERRIFTVALATGQRVTDIMMMRTTDIVDGALRVTQHKTGAELWLPVIPELADDLKANPPKNGYLIEGPKGQPYTSRHSITARLKRALRSVTTMEADVLKRRQLVPDSLNTHGLRKATCRRLAEAGCSEREIMSVSGHTSPAMVSKYVRKADQRKMAVQAMARMGMVKNGLVQPELSNT